MSEYRCRLFGWSNETLHNGGNYILEVALHEYLLQVRCLQGGALMVTLTANVLGAPSML
jgi:hypothetical protein